MQAHMYRFNDGSFVVHKITGNFKGRVSAWFDVNGTILDAERFDHADNNVPVKVGGPIWKHAQEIGRPYALPMQARRLMPAF